MLDITGDSLDLEFLETQIREMGLLDEWQLASSTA